MLLAPRRRRGQLRKMRSRVCSSSVTQEPEKGSHESTFGADRRRDVAGVPAYAGDCVRMLMQPFENVVRVRIIVGLVFWAYGGILYKVTSRYLEARRRRRDAIQSL